MFVGANCKKVRVAMFSSGAVVRPFSFHYPMPFLGTSEHVLHSCVNHAGARVQNNQCNTHSIIEQSSAQKKKKLKRETRLTTLQAT
jgi:hypothetical protein